MWITLLAMAVAVSLEPFRVGMTVLMISRPRPILRLLVFLGGGFAMGMTVGVIVLFVLRPALQSAHFTLPRVQIIVGALLLLNAAVVATGVLEGRGAGLAGRPTGYLGNSGRVPGNCSTAIRCGRRASRASASRCRPSTTSRCWLLSSPPAPPLPYR